jgi:hypothetical protein
MFAMPFGVKLECSRRLNHREIVSSLSHELQSNREILVRKAAGNGQSWQPA